MSEWTAARLQEEIRFKGFHNVAAAINAEREAGKLEADALIVQCLEQLAVEREAARKLREGGAQ